MRRAHWQLLLLAAMFAWAGATKLALAAPGNAVRGETVYSRCLACHALTYDRTGPRHCGLLGRVAGSVPQFLYSEAMKSAQFEWTEQALDDFLAAPMKAVPGTSMGYAGIPDAQERSDLIAYLKQQDTTGVCVQR